MFFCQNYFPADFVETCYFKDPDFVKCSTRSVQGLFDRLVIGKQVLIYFYDFYVQNHSQENCKKNLF